MMNIFYTPISEIANQSFTKILVDETQHCCVLKLTSTDGEEIYLRVDRSEVEGLVEQLQGVLND